MIVFMTLSKGKSKVRIGPITKHTETSIHFSSLLTGVSYIIIIIILLFSYIYLFNNLLFYY